MSNPKKELRTDLVTNSVDPFAATRVEVSPTEIEEAGEEAFAEHSGEDGGYESLPEGGKMAFRALGMLDPRDPRFRGAKQAAVDAVRDAKLAGIFNAEQPSREDRTREAIAASKDPAVRNQSPTGTVGEASVTSAPAPAPRTAIAPPAGDPSTTASTSSSGAPHGGEPNTTTPAVKGSSK